MICMIKSYDECRDFVSSFKDDVSFSDPMLTSEEQIQNNLIKAIENPEEHCVLGIYWNGLMIGLFAFLVIEDERYLEMLVGLSRDKDAYMEIFHYLERHYRGYDTDFVFNPGNFLLKKLLESKGAEFETEQQKMISVISVPEVDTTGVELYSEKYASQYFAIHNKDTFWTGEKVVAAQDCFRIFLAIHNDKVVGYMDATHCFDENELFDLFVLEEYRRMGYGKKLLAKALKMNEPNVMILLIEVDNGPAIRLYESMGFEKVQNRNNLTAHWKVSIHSQSGNSK